MLYSVLKVVVRFAARIFCRRIIVDKPEMLKEKGPLLIACNHPNSFLDAVILDILFEQPIWSLARGDAFLNKRITNLLYKLKMLPVYRPSEGVENLSENYKTFDACIELFRRNSLVLIFSEGLCVNEWHFRSLKKGTARLAYKCREEDIPLKILPVGINYSSFSRYGKNIFIHFGKPFSVNEFEKGLADGTFNQLFNNRLREELRPLVYEISKTDKQKQEELLTIRVPFFKKLLLAIPAALGFLIHAPLYLPVKAFVKKKFNNTVHYDSVTAALPVFLYPFYLIIIILIAYFIFHSPWVLVTLLLMPFTAWSYVQLKEQLD